VRHLVLPSELFERMTIIDILHLIKLSRDLLLSAVMIKFPNSTGIFGEGFRSCKLHGIVRLPEASCPPKRWYTWE